MTETLQIIEKPYLTTPKTDTFLSDAISEFLYYKGFKLKPKSVRTYSESLAELSSFFGPSRDIETITEEEAAGWIMQLDRSPSGRFQVWQTADIFFKWYFAGDPTKSPFFRIRLSKPRRDPIKGIDPDQVNKILKSIDGPNKNRDRAIVAVLFASGLRKEEFCSLQKQDVDLKTGAISVSVDSAKRSKFRQVYIFGKPLQLLNRYVRTLNEDEPALWQSPAGKPLTASGIHEILKRCSVAAKLPEIYDFHDYRRGCALSMHRSGARIIEISRHLGHADIKTTQRYIALDDTDNARTAANYAPLK